MSLALEGQTAVVTGGSSGIGRAISVAFAAEGADVVVADLQEASRDPDEQRTTVGIIEDDTEASARFVKCDVSDPDQTRAAVEAADEFGGINCMVNNAGIVETREFTEVTEDQFQRLMDVNLKGTFFGAQAAAVQMVEGDGGTIINMSSIAGLRGYGDLATYCTSKGAVRLLTYSLAAELGPEGVRVNAIHPGTIETAMTKQDVPIVGSESAEGARQDVPTRRFGDPEDIADAAVFLASDAGDYVNGESLTVDGGVTNTN